MQPPKAQPPDYWPLFDAYHRVREPVYRAIVAECGIGLNDLILDAGCGDAFYSRLIADVLGSGARVVAIDHNPALLRAQTDLDRSVQRCLCDIERAGLKRGAFDAIWLCRSMHAALDPLARMSALAALLRPGGKLIVIENDLAHYPILSWPPDFERRFRDALFHLFQSRSPNGASIERYYAACHLPAWLEQVGLRQVSIHTRVVEDVAPMRGEVEAYWKLSMDYLGDLIQPFLSPADRQTYACAFDPLCAEYVLSRPGYYCMELIAVACGTAP